jgi:hypothetical protein
MSAYVSKALRRKVIKRSNGKCEYCLFPERMSLFSFEIEHIIAEKHGGVTQADNLALACPFCNRFKGTDLGSIDPETGKLTFFFNPRTQKWQEHFKLEKNEIIGLTPEGRVTVIIFQFNNADRVLERQQLISSGQNLIDID